MDRSKIIPPQKANKATTAETSFLHASTRAGYLDLKGLCAYTSCTIRWLRDRLHDKSNTLPQYRVGGKILVKVDEFDKWMGTFRVIPENSADRIVDEILSSIL